MSAIAVHESIVPPSSSGGPPSWRSSVNFSIRVDENDQQVAFSGMLRPFVGDHMKPIRATLESAAKNASAELCLDFKRLKYMNSVAFLEINRFVRWAVDARPNLKIKLIISSVIPWAIRKFQVLQELYPNVSVEIYDKALYPVQRVLEDADFIDVLRLQERIIWEHEKKLLTQHGLQPGMRVADIACGFGDFAILLQQEFKPEYVLGVDHARPSLLYAQEHVRRLGLDNVEYQYGDAAALLLPDDSFDFVACRLALQVFPMPDQIMHELVRICKPGGRVYITNEMMSCIVGFPEYESIRWTYYEIAELAMKLGMNMNLGVRSNDLLKSAALEDLKMSLVDINNMNTSRHDFTKVVESWMDVAERIATNAGASEEIREKLRSGHRDFLDAISSDNGFASWPIYAASGRKPERMAWSGELERSSQMSSAQPNRSC